MYTRVFQVDFFEDFFYLYQFTSKIDKTHPTNINLVKKIFSSSSTASSAPVERQQLLGPDRDMAASNNRRDCTGSPEV